MKRLLSVFAILSLLVILVPESAEAANPEVRLPEHRSHVLRRHVDVDKVEFTTPVEETARPDTYRHYRAFPWFSSYLDSPTRSRLYRSYLSGLWLNDGQGYLGSYRDPLNNTNSRKRRTKFVCQAGLSEC